MKFILILCTSLLFISSSSAQWDTTYVVDSQLNCISPFDTSDRKLSDIIVGFPKHSNSNSLISYFIYQVSLSGQVFLDEAGKESEGPVLSFMNNYNSSNEELTFVLNAQDTIDIVPGEINDFYFHTYIFDPDSIDDNSGQFLVDFNFVGWVNIKNNENLQNVKSLNLEQNYPNPFNSRTKIKYSINQRSEVSLIIYNIQGKHIRTLVSSLVEPGSYEIMWDGKNEFGSDVSSGVYFYRIIQNKTFKTQRMLYLK